MMGVLGYPVTIGESFGGLGLIVGFLTRFSAASLIVSEPWYVVFTASSLAKGSSLS
jgi:uncharacterized membrane protein YphA (DoxX/SURF4 family)